jgi:hypothetical protein
LIERGDLIFFQISVIIVFDERLGAPLTQAFITLIPRRSVNQGELEVSRVVPV